MVKCNVYDFDGTIYKRDSTIDFYLYSLRKRPLIIRFFFKQIFGLVKFLFGKINTKELKEVFFCYVKDLKDIDQLIESFWDKKQKKIYDYYKKRHRKNDIVISASPLFLVEPMTKRLNIQTVIATNMDKKTGKINGENCRGEEKVNRLKELYKDIEIDNFFSDSLSDTPLALLAKKAYIIKKGKVIDWKKYKPSKISKLIKQFLDKSFLLFLIVGVINTFNGVLFAYLYSLVINNDNIAFIVGYITSLTISYFLNSFIAFKENLSFKKYIKFAISYIPNFIIQNLCVIIFLNILNLHKLIAYTIAAIIGIPVTYLCIKLFAFKKKNKK